MKNQYKPLIIILILAFHHLMAEELTPLELWKQPSSETSSLTFYKSNNAKVTVIVCPGGGYRNIVKGPEGHGIAKWLNSKNISAAVLAYTLPKGHHHLPLNDLKQAIQTLRDKSQSLGIDPQKIGVMGFSAGGHLSASSLTLLSVQDRPNFGVLIYPVISFGEYGHKGSQKNLLGDFHNDPKWINYYSLEQQIDSMLPPVFLAHAVDDKAVVIENSQLFYEKAISVQPKSKLLKLDQGGHGLNGYKGASWDLWQSEALKWIESL